MLWHDGNPNAVANCITLARENARSVREQISGEMWEAINKLFLLVRGANRRAVSRGAARVLRGAPQRRAPLPGLGGRHDDARRPVRVHPARPPARAGGEDGPDRGLALPDRGRARPRRSGARPAADRAARVVQRLRGVREAPRDAVRADPDRRGADPLGRLPARRAATASRAASTPSRGSRATRARRTGSSGGWSPRSSTARSATSPARP